MAKVVPLILLLCWALLGQDRISQRWAEDIERDYRLFRDPKLTEMLSRFTGELSGGWTQPIEVKAIHGASAEALSLPGGYIYLTSALLAAVETESELAAILAHQIGHIRAMHPTRLNQGIIVLPSGRSLCARLSENSYWPRGLEERVGVAEKEADMLGMTYLHQAGWEPEGLIDIFRKLDEQGLLNTGAPLDADFQRLHLRLLADLRDGREQRVTTSEFVRLWTRLSAGPPKRKARPPSLVQ